MKFTGTFITLFLALVFVLSFSACDDSEKDAGVLIDGDDDTTTEQDEAQETSDEGEIEEAVESSEMEDAAEQDLSDGDIDDTEDVEETEGEEEQITTPSLPIAHCGMPEYSLLAREEVGHLVEYESVPLWTLSAEAIEGILEEAGGGGLAPLAYGVKTYRYRYTTQDRGRQVEATSFLVIPTGNPPETLPIALSTHGTTGFSDPCAPTASMVEGPAVAALMTSFGYISVAPDYIGMAGFGEPSEVVHGYLIGEQTAIGSLDAVRAAEELLEALESPVQSNGQVIPWGGSQGGFAAFFAGLYADYYTPEYEIPAILALIAPLDLKPLMEAFTPQKGSGTGLVAASMAAMQIWYGDQLDLTQFFTNREPFFLADTLMERVFVTEECNPGEGIEDEQIEAVFTEEFRNAMAAGDWSEFPKLDCFMRENSPVSTSVSPLSWPPILIANGNEDSLVIVREMDEPFNQLCEQGYRLQHIECQNAAHSQGAIYSLPEQRDWLAARLAGEPIAEEDLCILTEPVCCEGTPEGCDK